MNHSKITFLLLKQLGTSFTYTFVKNFFKLQNQPSSSKTICDLLNIYDIESMTVRATTAQLKEVDYPVLVLVETEKNKEYVILNELETDQIKYTNGKGKTVSQSIEYFEKQWTGITILIDAGHQQPEPQYEINKKSERKRKLENVLSWSFGILILGICISLLLNNSPTVSIPLLFLKVFGIYICIQLIRESGGVHTAFSNHICKLNKKNLCREALNSSAAKIAGISLSDLGFFYFVITIAFLLLSNLDASFWMLTYSATLLALPFTIFLIAYQWRAKSWCLLCLLVLSLFWIEFLVLLQKSYPIQQQLYISHFILSIIVAGIVITLFYLFKKTWIKSLKAIGFQRLYHALKNSDEITDLVIENGKQVTDPEVLKNMELGYSDANNELIVLTDPMCGPCAEKHKELEGFLRYFEGHLSVKIIPIASLHDPFSTKVSKHMIHFFVSESKDKIDCISSWFRLIAKDEISFKKWSSSYPVTRNSEDYREIIEWVRSNQINYVPCLILNRKIVNEKYYLSDLKAYLKRKIN